MITKKLAITAGILALGIGTTIYINDTPKENSTLHTEVRSKQSPNDIALKKVKELNERVADGKEKVISQSAVFPDTTNEEAFQEADIVIKGTIDSVMQEYTENTDIPFTDFKINVEEYWKSNSNVENTKQLIVTQDGNTELEFEGHPLMKIGDEYVLFLKKVIDNNNEEKLIMISGPSGKFNVDNEIINQEVDNQSVDGESVEEFIEDSSNGEVTEPIIEIENE
ncbi:MULTISPECIES: hypothetical protein [Exiguobacterium]|jgi:cytoskeletal protein RodZ|uniref:hypothetical protein n=1 Tax=Exiguobacterium TaxID=33986 RepID=UPI001BECF444|nr:MULTISPECIES: hypothetical protein [Exiguobacterium]MCT4793576.1 hypothetical protein [Exiguobacterium artemiae]